MGLLTVTLVTNSRVGFTQFWRVEWGLHWLLTVTGGGSGG